MKQRSQIIRESLHEIRTVVNQLREIACDLSDCEISTDELVRCLNLLDRYRLAAAHSERLPPNTAVGTPFECHNASISAQNFKICRDPYGKLEDPPCIACGAPESACECEQDSAGDQSNENPGAATGHSRSSDRVTQRGAYLSWDDTMLCCDSEPVQISDEDYVCPKCTRICLGSHPEDEEVWAAERAAGWDPSP